MLASRHDDNDDDFFNLSEKFRQAGIYIYIYICKLILQNT